MLLRSVFIFLAGAMVGAGIIFFELNPDVPPASQDTERIEVGIAKLKPEDMWLEKFHFQVVPLDGVNSRHKYAILLVIPPVAGVHSPKGSTSTLDLTASTAYWTTVQTPGQGYSFPEGIQPIEIRGSDFGPNGDQVAVKFIDELIPTNKSYYQPKQHLLIGSSPN